MILAAFLAALTPQAPLQDAAGGSGSVPGAPYGPGGRAFAAVVAGPYDVENAPPVPDPRILGVEEGWGYYWVTGSNNGSPKIYQLDGNGNFVFEYAQVTQSPFWGHRDGAALETANRLFFGEENGMVVEYTYNPTTKRIAYKQTYTIVGVGWTIRALCVNPANQHFYTKDYTGDVYEFDLAGTIYGQDPSPNVSAYGFAWHSQTQKIWATDSGVELVELDPASGLPTGNSFETQLGGSQGGCDVYLDPRNPGKASLVMIHQILPDSLVVYSLEAGTTSNPVLSVTTPLTALTLATLTVDNATPGAPVRVGRSFTGAGPTTTSYGVVNLSPPIGVLPPMTANASGTATLSATLPAITAGRTIYLHGVDLISGLLTNSLALPIS